MSRPAGMLVLMLVGNFYQFHVQLNWSITLKRVGLKWNKMPPPVATAISFSVF